MNKVFVETYGCQMNEYDTELVKSILTKEKYTFVEDETKADIVMLNTCAIRENAHRKVYGRIHSLKHKRGADTVKIGILGCMATNLRTDLLENKNLEIDFIAGPDSYKRLPSLIEAATETGKKQFDLTLSEFETYSDVFPKREAGVNAWVAVMRGCNNFCTFCVVPYTRGRERSRTIENVVDEVKGLADQEVKQITLLGQNVNSYRSENQDFAQLLNSVSTVEGIERIRFTSPHPKDFPDNLLEVVANNSKVCKQIHLPLQAGNDRILEQMNRTYTKDEFLKLADKTRKIIPNVSLSTDIIVGFSGETDEEFKDTIDVMKQVEFDTAFMFKYSERKNTIAEKNFPDNIAEAIKTERIVELVDLQKEISLKKNKEHIGKTLEVLIENPSSRDANYSVGRTDGNALVIFEDGKHKTGDFVNVKITDASPRDLKGVLA